jgi:hypothetical protein
MFISAQNGESALKPVVVRILRLSVYIMFGLQMFAATVINAWLARTAAMRQAFTLLAAEHFIIAELATLAPFHGFGTLGTQ